MENLSGSHTHSAASCIQFYAPFLADSCLAGAKGSPVWKLQSRVAVVTGTGPASRQVKGKVG